MDKTEIRKKWKSVSRSLMESAATTRPDFEASRIHHFRMTFKSFRSCLRLIKSTQKSARNFSVPKELKYWFQEMGEVRNLQIQLKFIEENFTVEQEPPSVYRNLIANLLTRKIKFLNAGQAKWEDIQTRLEKLAEKLPSTLSRKKALKFIKARKKIMTDAFEKGRTDLALHTIRKMLKDIQNVHKLYAKNKKGRRTKKEIDHLIDELGKYQDLRIKLGYLKPPYLKTISEQEKSGLIRLKSQLQALKQRSRTALIEKILTSSYWE